MNMKYKNKYSTWFGATAMLLMISSCDGFLDKMPDNRTELDNNSATSRLSLFYRYLRTKLQN